MLKSKANYICTSCDFVNLGYLGKCPNCDQWNTFVNHNITKENESKNNLNNYNFDQRAKSTSEISAITTTNNFEDRIKTGFNTLDIALGSGLVQGSVILLAGQPGIGKSTLLTQLASNISEKVIYISAEESIEQISLRAKRLNINKLNLFSTTSLDEIFQLVNSTDTKIVILDSIQTIFCESINSPIGSIMQVKECANLIVKYAKQKNICFIIVGHVTKDGYVAGPKVLEHIVDCVLQFENYSLNNLRVIKSIKNRFGPTTDLVMFSMSNSGLVEVESPSKYLLAQRSNNQDSIPAGCLITVNSASANSMLLEVQALVTQTFLPNPKRVANGFDYNRLLQIIAVLDKNLGLNLNKYDIYINIVGGLEIDDTSADLAIALSIISSYLNKPIAPLSIAIGEIGLTGEIRNFYDNKKIIDESIKLGINRLIANLSDNNFSNNLIKLNSVDTIKKAFNTVFK